jgi:peptidoglycan/LPS O-acetylase OafA/YrhL
MNESTKRIPSLDGLRAVSVLLVVLTHFTGELPLAINRAMGNLGVRFFFVISGFLITSILLAELNKTASINLTKFYFRRTLRIFPAYYFYLLMIGLAAAVGILQIPFSSFISPLTYTSNYIAPGAWELGHSWSLAIEEQFYLLFPGLMVMTTLAVYRKLLILIVILSPLIRIISYWRLEGADFPIWFYFGFHTNIDALAIGCLLAIYQERLHRNEHYKNFLGSSTAFFLLPLVIAAVVCNYTYQSLYHGLGITLLNVSIVLMIDWLVVNHASLPGKFLNSRPLCFIGTLSYSIYLWQQPFSKFAADKWWTHFPANFILIAVFSLLSYYFIEKKFLTLRQALENKIFNKSTKNLRIQTEVV